MPTRNGYTLPHIHHDPTIPPDSAATAPGQQPDKVAIGSTLAALMTLNTDNLYRSFKIPTGYISDPSFHIHWTKSVDTNQQGNSVLWQISYNVWAGMGGDLALAPTVLQYEDTYEDAGTTTRITHRTPNLPAVGFVPGYYLGVKVECLTPAGSPLGGEPALLTLDLIFRDKVDR